GNLDVSLNSFGQSLVTVIYHYIPNNCLKPGNYTIVQNPEPAGFLDGKESQQGIVLPTPPGGDTIPVTISSSDQTLTHNDFGELVAAKLSGFVYHDANNNGVKEAGEVAIGNVTVTLAGTDDVGPISKTATTDVNGHYEFGDLRPGIYQVNEAQPTNFLDGKDT